MHTPVKEDGGESSSTNGSSNQGGDLSIPPLPAPPRPSADAGLVPPTPASDDVPSRVSGSVTEADDIDIFTMAPVAALKMLCALVEEMVQMTGDIPPTPPVSLPTTPREPVLQENRVHYGIVDPQCHVEEQEDCDVPARSKTPIGSPEAHPTEPFHVIGSNTELLHLQHGAITRKFYSKRPPGIALEEYLLRLHRYCPMSTAVYLATSLYIHRLAIIERIIPVTERNIHRLLLAGLRVAMKALEDLSYPHRRFAKVGGVSEPELGRLEVSFCFLTNFDLRVTREMLHTQAVMMRDSARFQGLSKTFQPVLPTGRGMSIRSVIQISGAK